MKYGSLRLKTTLEVLSFRPEKNSLNMWNLKESMHFLSVNFLELNRGELWVLKICYRHQTHICYQWRRNREPKCSFFTSDRRRIILLNFYLVFIFKHCFHSNYELSTNEFKNETLEATSLKKDDVWSNDASKLALLMNVIDIV